MYDDDVTMCPMFEKIFIFISLFVLLCFNLHYSFIHFYYHSAHFCYNYIIIVYSIKYILENNNFLTFIIKSQKVYMHHSIVGTF